ncbi:uncharacterized protein LOC129913197 [Episyrphus balteatus]|uniref:uncharacterized protein LOC129913197 n=1 Tax=Episyrphus balteatus TaxID=286459 RepID=UPI002486C040|nr:uncharacterized protein LOC129913197 [Episyrphus balteatus]
MNGELNNIFPFVLHTLSSKPRQEESQKKLLKELRQKLKDEDIVYTNLKEEFQQALEIGQDMGIFNLTEENIALPFSLKTKKKEAVTSRSKSNPVRTSKRDQSEETDKERMSRRRRGRSSSRRRMSRSRSRGRSQRSRRSRRGSRK